jgi:hypothetical protein
MRTRPDEAKLTDPLRLLIQAYCFFSGGGATCEAAAAPAAVFISTSPARMTCFRRGGFRLRRGVAGRE